MARLSFIAVIFGAAGVAGSLENGTIAGVIAAGVVHISGILGMAVAKKMER